ncbi:MAG TPA: methyl-accepting chemotaxis protein [Dissulfurispiraceae bacterium]
MRLKDLSLRWKTAVPIIFCIAIGVAFTILFTGYKTKEIVLDEIRTSSLEGYRDTVLNSLTAMMFAGNYKDSKEHFLDQMKKISDIKVMRAASVDKDFGQDNGKGDNRPSDAVEREVVEKGVTRVMLENGNIRGVYPYIAKSDYMGKNCLSCHNVKEGEVLGAVSIRIPIEKSFGRIRSLQYLYIALGLVGIVGMMALVLVVINITHKPLRNFVVDLKELSKKYSGLDFSHQEGDEIAQVAANVQQVCHHLTGMINNVMVTSSKILPVIDVLKGVVEKTAAGAKSQSGQAAQIATAAEEMSQTIGDIAKNASLAAETSAGALEIASGGKEVADGAVEGVKGVHASTEELAKMVERLNHNVGEIGDIVTVIKDIADQTNLLALNAAIEAARAGEQGRGFAVVADEVRKLAERTIRATAEISGKIQAVQKESEHTATYMEGATEKSMNAAKHIGNVGVSLHTILVEVQKVKDEITKIATAVEEQSTTTDEVAKNIENTSAIARDIEGMSGKVLDEVLRLTQVADELRGITAGVRTKGGAVVMLELAKSDHRGFVGKVASCLKGENPMDLSKMPDHHTCRFGKWYYKEGGDICGDMDTFKAIEPPHEKIHRLAKEAVAAFQAGNTTKAEQFYQEMVPVSKQITDLLDTIKKECEEDSA